MDKHSGPQNPTFTYSFLLFTETEYAFQRKKPIVPLMLQRKYKPDGWLGLIMGAKLYINFDGKYKYEEAMTMLLKELCGRGTGSGHAIEKGLLLFAGNDQNLQTIKANNLQ